MSRPPSCTPRTNTWLAIRETIAAGWASTAVCRRSSVAANADGEEVARITEAPKALAAGMERQRRLAKSLSRKQKGSRNRRDAAAKLGRHHHHVANVRRHFLHQVSNALVKTHDRLVIEDLQRVRDAGQPSTGPSRSPTLAGPSSPAMLSYKQSWRCGESLSRIAGSRRASVCPVCGAIRGDLALADRVFTCACGHSADRDCNAAVNLARWGHPQSFTSIPGPPSNGAGPPMPDDGTALTSTPYVLVKPARKTRELTFRPHQRPEPKTPRRAVPINSPELLGTL